jgi:hypothetical protein
MIYYFLFYALIFFTICLLDKILKKNLSSIKISLISFFAASLALLVWNVLASYFLANEGLGNGVSVVLRSTLSIIVLLVYSVFFGVLRYLFQKYIR